MTVALALLDLQNGILLSDRIKWEDPGLPERALAAAREVLAAARAHGALIVHVRVVRPAHRGTFDLPRSANAIKSGRAPRDILPLAAGTPEVELALKPASGEEIVDKVSVSAFQGTRLDSLLRNADVRDVVVAGAFTHMVVESTVRQGFDLGFRMTVVEDACCAPSSALHAAALSVGLPNFAIIARSSDMAEIFARGGRDG